MRELEDVIRDACAVFSSLRIPYVIVGGVAVNLLGRARSTFDIDAIADIDAAEAERLVRAFKRSGFEVSREDIEDALGEKGHFSVFDSRSGYRIDCKGATRRTRSVCSLNAGACALPASSSSWTPRRTSS